MRISRYLTVALVCLCCVPAAGLAQTTGQVSIGAGGSYNMPTGVFAETDGLITNLPQTGFATDGTSYWVKAFYHLSPKFALFATYAKPQFNVDNEAVEAQVLEQYAQIWTYEAGYELTVICFGARLTPIRIALAEPYVQAGVARYNTDIIQTVGGTRSVLESDYSNTVNFGAGVLAHIGTVAVDAGIVYHATEILINGQTLKYKATWLEIGLSLLYSFGG